MSIIPKSVMNLQAELNNMLAHMMAHSRHRPGNLPRVDARMRFTSGRGRSFLGGTDLLHSIHPAESPEGSGWE